MWPDQDDLDAEIEAALCGDFAGNHAEDVKWARSVVAAVVLAALGILTIVVAVLSNLP